MGSEGYGTMIIKSSNRFVDVGGESDGKLWISRMAAILLLGAGSFVAGRASAGAGALELAQTPHDALSPDLHSLSAILPPADSKAAFDFPATNPLAKYSGGGEAVPPPAQQLRLWAVYDSILKTRTFVDLTHAFDPSIPHWKGFTPESVKTLYTYDKDGFWAENYCHVGQWGTHLDPPAHFAKGKRTIDLIRPDEMLLPLVVIDVHKEAAENPDYTLTMENIRAWESRNGQLIPKGSFVALRTDWSKRWPSSAEMANLDAQGVAHYPGWSMECLKYLYEERGITASGHETTDTDPGVAVSKDDYSLETYILSLDHYQVELLTNLDQVPEVGALVVVSFPKPLAGSGFPARVFAILP